MNRHMRNRMYGGVGGRRAQARPPLDRSEAEDERHSREQSVRAHF
jgi:hypothetical protein